MALNMTSGILAHQKASKDAHFPGILQKMPRLRDDCYVAICLLSAISGCLLAVHIDGILEAGIAPPPHASLTFINLCLLQPPPPPNKGSTSGNPRLRSLLPDTYCPRLGVK